MFEGCPAAKPGIPFQKRRNNMNTRIDYCGVIVLLRGLMEQGLFTRNEAEKIARRIAAETRADLIISL